MRPFKFIVFWMICFLNHSTAANRFHWGALLSNNVVTFPVTGYPATVYNGFHPGIDFLIEHPIKKHEKNQIWMAYHGGVYYHRFFQTGIRLYPEISYRRVFSKRINAQVGILGGYLHALTDYDRFSLQADGTYQKIPNWHGRAQFLFGLGIGASYSIIKSDAEKCRLNLQFKSFFQGPFAGSYVLIIPTNSLMLGVTFPISSSQNHK